MPRGAGFFGAGAGPGIDTPYRAYTVSQCGACGLAHGGCRKPKWGHSGQGRKRVLVVGTAPSYAEDKAGTHHQDGAGAFLREGLRRAGLLLEEDCWYATALQCHPGAKGVGSSRVAYCEPRLRDIIQKLRPSVIIPCGQWAIAGVVGRSSATWAVGAADRWVGHRIPEYSLGAWVCPVHSPGRVLSTGKAAKPRGNPVVDLWWDRHLDAAASLVDTPLPPATDWAAQVVRTTPGQAAVWLDRITASGAGVVAFDYEATMLKPEGRDAAIVSAAVAWGTGPRATRCFAYPWEGPAIAATSRLLASPVPKVAANAKFEERWTMAKLGHGVRAWAWDTMLAAHWLDPRPETKGLKFQAYVKLGCPAYNTAVEPYLKSPGPQVANRVRELPLATLLLYNGMDALLEYALAAEQMAESNYPGPLIHKEKP